VAALACLLAATLTAGRARADGPGSTEPLVSETSPRFGSDLTLDLNSGGPSVGFDFEVPASELQFVRVPAGYGAQVRISVVFRGKGKDAEGGDVWEDRFVVPTFADTRNPSQRVRYHRDFPLAPAPYDVTVTLEDLSGGRTSKAHGKVTVAQFGPGMLGIGNLELGLCGVDSTFVRVPSRRFEADLDAFCVSGVVFDQAKGDSARTYHVHYAVRADVGDDLVHGDSALTVAPRGHFQLKPNVRDLFLGSYTLELEIREGDRKFRTQRTFEVETLGMPHGQNYQTLVEILSNIATGEEYQRLRKAESDSARAAEWERFWARRDPTPDTPRNEAMIEFFSRVRYANAHFAGQLGAGWRTDQGRVYIRYGAPDQIEDRAATYYDPPLQIWHYYTLARDFVFADREGFGRYELLSPGLDR
jgi:GWxTD domain-containing protein